MKKVCYFIALIALVILPIKANAESTLDYKISNPDANGVYTVEIFQKVGEGTPYSAFDGNLVAQHCLIQAIDGTTDFQISPASSIDPSGTTAHIITTYVNSVYNGTGQQVKVAEFKYMHDPAYTGDEVYKVTLSISGSPDVVITEKTTPNAKTGSALPYVAIIGGIALIGAAYAISRRSTKLYRM